MARSTLPPDPARGPAGPRGQAGLGVSRGTKLLAGSMIALAVILGGADLLSNYIQNQHAEQSQSQQRAQFEAAQKQANAAVEAKLCKSLLPLESLAQLKPPAGNAADNPSRLYEQQLSAKLAPLAQLGPDIGCRP